jgi:hypothetical protein
MTASQCCGSELIFFRFGFGSAYFFTKLDSVSDPYTNILTRNCFKCCLSLLLYVFWNLHDREQSFPTEKLTGTFFLFQVFDLRFFTIFYFTTVSESESNSELFFGFGSSLNIRILLESKTTKLILLDSLLQEIGI